MAYLAFFFFFGEIMWQKKHCIREHFYKEREVQHCFTILDLYDFDGTAILENNMATTYKIKLLLLHDQTISVLGIYPR